NVTPNASAAANCAPARPPVRNEPDRGMAASATPDAARVGAARPAPPTAHRPSWPVLTTTSPAPSTAMRLSLPSTPDCGLAAWRDRAARRCAPAATAALVLLPPVAATPRPG